MYTTEFFLLAAILIAVFLIVGFSREEPVESENPRKGGRWRCFRVTIDPLRGGRRGDTVVREEPQGVELQILEGNLGDLPLRLGEKSHRTLIRLDCRRFTCQPVQVLRLAGRPWLALKTNGSGKFPELRALRGARAPSLPDAAELSLQGSLRKREYEIRAGGKLAASVTRLNGGGRSRKRSVDYHVEVDRRRQAMPFLGLILALELHATTEERRKSL